MSNLFWQERSVSKMGCEESKRKEVREMERRFADERTKIAWEIAKQIKKLSREIEPESVYSSFRQVTFSPENRSRGFYAIFMVGTVVGTERRGVFVVPDRTVSILDRLGIPFEDITE